MLKRIKEYLNKPLELYHSEENSRRRKVFWWIAAIGFGAALLFYILIWSGNLDSNAETLDRFYKALFYYLSFASLGVAFYSLIASFYICSRKRHSKKIEKVIKVLFYMITIAIFILLLPISLAIFVLYRISKYRAISIESILIVIELFGLNMVTILLASPLINPISRGVSLFNERAPLNKGTVELLIYFLFVEFINLMFNHVFIELVNKPYINSIEGKKQNEREKEYQKKRLYGLHLLVLIIVYFAAVLVKMEFGSESIKDAVTCVTLIILYLDKRKEWGKKKQRSEV